MPLFRSVLFALASLGLAAGCTLSGVGDPGGGDSPDAGAGGGGDLDTVELSGSITEGGTWSGTITLIGDTIIESGVQVTIAPDTEILALQGMQLRVRGTLAVDGTEAAPVSLNPHADAPGWGGIVAESGGSVTLRHATGKSVATLLYCHAGAVACVLESVDFEQVGKAVVAEGTALVDRSRIRDTANGGLTVAGNGDLTIRDTVILTSLGDLIVATGGSLTIEYSEVGGAQGSYEHCNLHIGAADAVSITRTTIHGGVYGIMIGNTNGAIIQYNNFMDNGAGNDISPVGPNAYVDLRYNYWDQGAPLLGGDYDTSSPSLEPLLEVGPRP